MAGWQNVIWLLLVQRTMRGRKCKGSKEEKSVGSSGVSIRSDTVRKIASSISGGRDFSLGTGVDSMPSEMA